MASGCKCVQNYLENLQKSVLIKKRITTTPRIGGSPKTWAKKHGQCPEGNSTDPIAYINDNIFVFCLICYHLK